MFYIIIINNMETSLMKLGAEISNCINDTAYVTLSKIMKGEETKTSNPT